MKKYFTEVKYFIKIAFYAIRCEDFHFYWWEPKLQVGIWASEYDGYHFAFNLYFCSFGWWPECNS